MKMVGIVCVCFAFSFVLEKRYSSLKGQQATQGKKKKKNKGNAKSCVHHPSSNTKSEPRHIISLNLSDYCKSLAILRPSSRLVKGVHKWKGWLL